MKIPAKFKSGLVTYSVHLVEKIEYDMEAELLFGKTIKGKVFKNGGFIFGICDPTSQSVWLATKDMNGDPISQERLVSTFYHELAHALVGETANNEVNMDEVFIEALGKNLYMFASHEFEGEAELYVEDEDEEEEVVKELKKKSKKK